MTSNDEMSQAAPAGGQTDLPLPTGFNVQSLPRPTESPASDSEATQPRTGLIESAGASPRAAFSTHVHQYIREYIQLADQKAMFFFAGSTALLAFLFRAGVSSRWLKPLMSWNILDLVSFVAMASLGIAALFAMWVIIPRTTGSRRGHVFWEAIAEFSTARDYADDVAQLTTATLAQLHAEHCHDLSKVCRSKYKTLRVALWIGAVGLFATVIVLLFVRSVPGTT